MKRISLAASMLAVAVLSTTAAGASPRVLYAAAVQNHQSRHPAQNSTQKQNRRGNQPTQFFVGTIVRAGTKYILEDKASGASYQLDKQDKARQFEGEDVKITGVLDPSTNTIEISDIQSQKGK